MSHDYRGALPPLGAASVDGAVGERRGAGWGQQCIPEYMTRCSRSDRSQPGLMKPKHFHRCFHTLGSTSSHQHRPTPPSFHLPPAQRFDALMWSLLFSSRWTLRHSIGGAARSGSAKLTRRCSFSPDLTGGIKGDLRLRPYFWVGGRWSKALNASEAGTIDIPTVPSLRLQKTHNPLNHGLGSFPPIPSPTGPPTHTGDNSELRRGWRGV